MIDSRKAKLKVFLGACFASAFAAIVLAETLPAPAQEYGNITPPPPRPRRAYSTIDTYRYTHGDYATDITPRPRRPKKVRPVVKKVKPKREDTGSSSTTSSTTGVSTNTSSITTGGSTRGIDTGSSTRSTTTGGNTSSTTAGGNTSSTTAGGSTGSTTTGNTSTESGTANANNWSTGDLTGVSKFSGFKFKPKVKLQPPDDKALEVQSANLSLIPTRPQMPPPPTSLGGF